MCPIGVTKKKTLYRRTEQLENYVLTMVERSPFSSIWRISTCLHKQMYGFCFIFIPHPTWLVFESAIIFYLEEFCQWILRCQDRYNKINLRIMFKRDGITSKRN